LWNAWKDRLLADLHTATRLALRRGLEHPVAAAEHSAETRDAARTLLLAQGVDDDAIQRVFASMPADVFLRGRPDQIAWQASAMSGMDATATVVAVRPFGAQAGALEVFVHSPDRDGLFAAIVATLDRIGLAIQQARLLRGPHGDVFDTFQVLRSIGQQTHGQRGHALHAIDAREVERRLGSALSTPDLDTIKPARRSQPRHLRHFRIAPQIQFSATNDGRRTLLSLVCTDRPGLLAAVTRVLRMHRLRVRDARIATFGERAEDVFQITDEHDNALTETRQQTLREALTACLEGESPSRKAIDHDVETR
jgi:[protein-PII] uridylyltransferase